MAEDTLTLSFKVRVSDYRQEQSSESGQLTVSQGVNIFGSGQTDGKSGQITLCRHTDVSLAGEDFIRGSYQPVVSFPFGSAMKLSFQLYDCKGKKLDAQTLSAAYIAIGELSHPATLNSDGTISYLFLKSDYKVLVKGQIYDTVLSVVDSQGNNSIVSKQLIRLD
ncbi:hypothetical protein ErPhphiEa104_gp047 [Erwinia phage phiEa104]|uniref:Uncharacterized protein n=1 Tax=Erwinia phage phiEa104 TaxID=925986 RepID=E5AFX8_9CAUD|nr:hypothetical protein ErPhphiEa104_gp047 [Erwinia phage phiEa104]CBX44390.1 conserved hypothetical protein [Erwinia phage phiEa104]